MFLFLYLYLSLYSLRVDATCNVRIHTYLLFSSFYFFFLQSTVDVHTVPLILSIVSRY